MGGPGVRPSSVNQVFAEPVHVRQWSPRRPERAAQLRETYGVEVVAAADAAKAAETLVIAVKPQDMIMLLDEIAPHVPAVLPPEAPKKKKRVPRKKPAAATTV